MIPNLFTRPSEEVDAHYGFEVERIERELFLQAKKLRPEGNLSNLSQGLHEGHQTWVGLEPQVILTPYEELVLLCRHLNPKAGEHLVDLGAGYGRLGLILHELYPESFFTGYELVSERVAEGKRIFKKWNCERATLITQDLTSPSFSLPEADHYFIYDYGKVAHIRQTLKQLEVLADTKKFKVIARGKGTQSLIEYEHPWLAEIYPVIREENFSIYSMSL